MPATVELIVAFAAEELVVAFTTTEKVVSVTTPDHVVAAFAVENVVSVGLSDLDGSDLISSRREVTTRDGVQDIARRTSQTKRTLEPRMQSDDAVFVDSGVRSHLCEGSGVGWNLVVDLGSRVPDLVAVDDEGGVSGPFDEVSVGIEQVDELRIVVADEGVVTGDDHRGETQVLRQPIERRGIELDGADCAWSQRSAGSCEGFGDPT